LSHFFITIALQDLIEKVNGKVINTSSNWNEYSSEMNFDGFKGEKLDGGYSSYARSKLYIIMFTRKLQQIFKEKKSDASTYSYHPGGVHTEMFAKAFPYVLYKLFQAYLYLKLRSPEQGIATGMYLCANEEANNNSFKGNYFVSNKIIEHNSLGYIQQNIDDLWNITMKIYKDNGF
jgi:WW domain-containing oxidoreductase